METLLTANSVYKQLRIAGIREEAPGVKTFTLQPLDGELLYTAGQFLTFIFNHHHKEERRSFSISSTPALDEPLSITLKRIENGAYSRWLTDRAEVGDVLYTTGAGGLFTLPDEPGRGTQLFLLAAGIGITPIYALLKTVLHNYPGLQVVLIYSNRNREETVFYNELVALRTRYEDRFKIEFLFSNAFNLGRARLSKWLLPRLIDEYATVPKESRLFYLCGPFAYMRMAIISLEEQGISPDNIRKEHFDTAAHLPHALPPDIEERQVHLSLYGEDHHFSVQYPNSILKTAKKLGIAMPYSCETGRCGSCAALCVTGRVWMSYNEVLTDKDLTSGKVLTCTGYPVNGDVALIV